MLPPPRGPRGSRRGVLLGEACPLRHGTSDCPPKAEFLVPPSTNVHNLRRCMGCASRGLGRARGESCPNQPPRSSPVFPLSAFPPVHACNIRGKSYKVYLMGGHLASHMGGGGSGVGGERQRYHTCRVMVYLSLPLPASCPSLQHIVSFYISFCMDSVCTNLH